MSAGTNGEGTAFRLICATNPDLKSAVGRGEFRTDLYYRVAGSVISLPSLRQRRQDILPLVSHFMRELRAGEPECGLDDQVKSYLLGLEYPGNVRELRQIVSRMCARHAGEGPMSLGDLAPEDLRRQSTAPAAWREGDFEICIRRALFEGANLREIGREASECAIRLALEETLGNLRQAARKLGVTDRALQIRRAVRRDNGSPPLDALTDTESA
ncbi:MAG: sigma 54-interacting transcriptional regulator [Paludibaculum sp.]